MVAEQPVWVTAAIPAAAFSVLAGTFLLGQSLKCTGDLDAILGGATGRQALLPMLRHGLTHPVDLLTYTVPIFLGIWALLCANALLRHLPQLAVVMGLFPFALLIVGVVVLAPGVCGPGPGPMALALISGGLYAALAGGIVLAVRRKP